jgi:hypothetical protein
LKLRIKISVGLLRTHDVLKRADVADLQGTTATVTPA